MANEDAQARIALTCIIKDDTESKIYKRMLDSFMPYCSGLYVAITGISGKHEKIKKITKKYGGKFISTSPETHPDIYSKVNGKLIFSNFAEARNVSFSLVDEEYDYLTWADVDDVLSNGEELLQASSLAKQKDLDGMFFTYWYAMRFDEKGNIKDIVVDQLRERLLKPNVYKWVSRLHEVAVVKDSNYKPRQAEWQLTEGRTCVWQHYTTEERTLQNLQRNIQILDIQIAEEEGKDPRTLYYLAKTYFDISDKESLEKALELLKKYFEMSGWDAERANAREYEGLIHEKLGNLHGALESYHQAIKEYPAFIQPYLRLAGVYFDLGQRDFAKHWLDTGMRLETRGADTTIGNPYELKLLACTLKIREAQEFKQTKDMVYWADVRRKILGTDDGLYDAMYEHDYINDSARGFFNYAKWLKDHNLTKNIEILLSTIPVEFEGLPFIHTIANSFLEPKTWSNKSIVYYASFGTPHMEKWGFDSLRSGIGGSETAVIALSEEWQKMGYEVTVFADIKEPSVSPSGVEWKPYYTLNFKDNFNIFILWRSPHLVNRVENARKLFMDLHDVASQIDWTKEKMEKIDKVFFKSEHHRKHVPDLPDEKAVVISNGIFI